MSMLAPPSLGVRKRTEDAAPSFNGSSTRFAIIPAGALACAAATTAGIGCLSPEAPALGVEAARISRCRRSALPETPMTIIGTHRISATHKWICTSMLRNACHLIWA